MHILVLQHVRVEHPGIFRHFLTEDGHSWDAIELDEGEALPALDGYDAVWAMGGPMDVWQEDDYPWLVAEKALIKEAVEGRGMPFLGLCLGHQLLAEALGGEVGPSKSPEIGILDVQMTELGAEGVWMDGLPERFKALQWHSAEITRLPAGAEVLATSPDCAVQALKWGPRAYSAQFHVEIEADTVSNWAKIPAYSEALERALGPDGVMQMQASAEENMKQFNAIAERLYINWLQAAAQA